MKLNFLYISKDRDSKIKLTKRKENIVKINFVLSSGIGFKSINDDGVYRPSDLRIFFLKTSSYDLNLSGNSSLFSIFFRIIELIFNLIDNSPIVRPFASLASLMEDNLFKNYLNNLNA
tara:strand:+ start:119 stop:472 length:354 start_codon:yes stop_codon:yes gene_type:complete